MMSWVAEGGGGQQEKSSALFSLVACFSVIIVHIFPSKFNKKILTILDISILFPF